MLSDFAYILLFLIGGFIFAAIGLFAASLIRPKRPNPEKLSTYECGEEPTGNAWGNFNIRFYIVALIFVLFDVELVFLFPWATVFGNKEFIQETSGLWGWFSLVEMFIFLGILIIGLVYAWRKGFLDWVRPKPQVEDYASPVPPNLYEQVNQRYESKVKEEVIAK